MMDVGYTTPAFRTPNIDRLLKQGMTFSNAYMPAANCAPSRATLNSGKWPSRHGVYTVGTSERGKPEDRKLIPTPNTEHLSPEFYTLAEALRAGGYRTIHLGKYHIGNDPRQDGFEVNVGGDHRGGPYGDGYFSPWGRGPMTEWSDTVPPGTHRVDVYVREAIRFIETHQDEPMFIHFAPYLVHTPITPVPEYVGHYAGTGLNADYASMVEKLDEAVGKLLDALEEKGLTDKTLVVFTSDHGGIAKFHSQAPLRAGKGSYYEGGIRVPFLMRWPGVIEAGSRSDELVNGLDLYPTFMEAAGIAAPDDLDGVSLMPLMRASGDWEPVPQFWHFPIYLQAYDGKLDDARDPLFRTRPGSAMRHRQWKLLEFFEDGALELYDLEADPGERNNLSGTLPEKTAELHQMLKDWRARTNSPVPTELNPDYHPADKKPNILFILLDDLGKEWISAYGAEDIKTPNIDRLAGEGIRFENFYTMPQCTPTRISFMTGQYPFRHGWINHWDVPRWGGGAHFDATMNPSVARMMQRAGYQTAVAGKWQVNDFRVQPEVMRDHGFDDYCMWTGYEAGNPPSAERYWDPYIHTRAGSRTYEGKFGTDVFTDFLIDFMEANQDKPMFLYFAMCLPHSPLVTTPLETNAEGPMAKHQAMVRYIDHTVQRLVDAVETLGLRENTLIILTSDNGTSGNITGTRQGKKIRGAKAKIHEAGTTVPFIVSQPGTVPQGVVSEALLDITDMLPTFVEVGGGSLDRRYTYDGQSMADVFHGKSPHGPRQWILSMGGGNNAKLTDKGVENQWHFRDRVIRDQRYKLYISTARQPEKLFDLKEDPWETRNLIDDPAHSEVKERLFRYISHHPAMDNDPIYQPLGPQPWDVKVTAESQRWKRGKPVEQP